MPWGSLLPRGSPSGPASPCCTPSSSLFPALDSYLTIQSNAAYLTGYPTFKRTQPPGGSLAASLGQVAGPQVAPFGLDGSERDALASPDHEAGAGHHLPLGRGPHRDAPLRDRDRQGHRRHHGLPRAGPARLRPGRLRRATTAGTPSTRRPTWPGWPGTPSSPTPSSPLSERVGFESWLIERKIGEKVYAYMDVAPGAGRRGSQSLRAGWQGVGPEELKGAHRYTVTLDPETPANKTLEIRSHVEMVKAGFESTAMAIEALGGDPGEVERELILENLKRSARGAGAAEAARLPEAGTHGRAGPRPGRGCPPGPRRCRPVRPRRAACRGCPPSWRPCWRRAGLAALRAWGQGLVGPALGRGVSISRLWWHRDTGCR